MTLKLIENWINLNLTCDACHMTKSVKYMVRCPKTGKAMTVCNLCAAMMIGDSDDA